MSGSLPQLQTFKLPDVSGVVTALQGLELNRMRSQQLQGAEQERNNLRAVFADPNFNPSSPDAAARILRAAPNTGAQVFNALTAGQREQRQAQTALTESEIKSIELGQRLLVPVRELPEAERPRAYAAWLANMERRIPGFSNFAPREYSDAGYYALLSKASEIVAGQRPRTPVVTQVPGMPPFLTDPITGITRPATEAGAPPPAAPSAATPPGQTAAAPRSQSTDPLLIDAAIRRNEGTGRNPASSAVGPYQFVDSTFVDQFRRNFPDIARNLPPEQILTFRGGQLPDGRRVEDVMGPALTRQNQESLARAGFAPSAGNTYLAHFLGAGGAQAVLRADPNTPISQLVSPEAIRANPSILGVPGVTAGQIVQWANNTIDVGPRDARQRLASGNAMAPGAAPVNAMLAPQNATAVQRPLGVPEFPGLPRAATLSDADLLKRIRDVQSKEAEALMLEQIRRETAASRAAEAGMTAGATARAQADVRREEQPARVQEAGQTVSAQETARIQVREAEARRAETEKLNTAINELERISRPGGLLERSTGGGLNAIVDRFFNFFNAPTEGAVAIGALAPIADIVLKMVPRFEGPQSDKDTASYQAAAGQLADPNVPNETRIAAAREILRLFKNRRDQFSYSADGAAPAATAGAPAARAEPPQAAPQYREGQRAVGPNGQRIEFRNGQWVPIR